MSYRIEQKLLIDNSKIIDFKSFLVKKNAKQLFQKRIIKSLYFDNHNYDMYNDSIEGLTPRKKIRIRNYPNTKDVDYYLETKISSVEGRFKTRKLLDAKKNNSLIKNGLIDSQYGLCTPCLFVSYEREYFKINDVRISVDNNINYKLYSNIFKNNDQIKILDEPKFSKTNYWLIIAILKNNKLKKELMNALTKEGIKFRSVWRPLHTLKIFKDCQRDKLENTLNIFNKSINLPSSPGISYKKK